MDIPTDTHLTRCDTSQNVPAESSTADRGQDAALGEVDLVPVCLNSPPSNVPLGLVMDNDAIEVHEGQYLLAIDLLKSDEEPPDIETLRGEIRDEHNRTHSQQDIPPVISREALPSEGAVVPADRSTSFTSVASEGHVIVRHKGPLLLCKGTVSPPKVSCEESEDNRLTCDQMLHAELEHVHGASLVRLTNETRGDLDCEDLAPSSLPPSSSPPQLFSSSPCASSQSSASDFESLKMVLSVEVEGCASSEEGFHEDYTVSASQDETCLEPRNFHGHDVASAATSPKTGDCCFRKDSTSCIEDSVSPSTKRIAYQCDLDELYGSQPVKRPKVDCRPYLPPTPKRATLVSQHHQFRKLAAPFRPPLKLPIVTDGPAQAANDKEAESAISFVPLKTSQDKIGLKGYAMRRLPAHYKVANTSKSVNQFKSPLVNRGLPAESRTIRLTPALQALERKLQLLKRAIKVKEDKDEEILVRLTEKWIEAGREAAYDVWDATKDAGDFGVKEAFIRRSFGWESTHNENMPWDWDIKSGDAGEESCDLDLPLTSCGAGRPAPEEDGDIGCKTLGTMLRQLGIAPEIFGWDDDKETFSD